MERSGAGFSHGETGMLSLPLHVHSAQKRPGFPGLFLFMERQLASISPGEAAIEVMRSSALLLVAWRHRFAAFFIPPFLMRFVGRFLRDHLDIGRAPCRERVCQYV